MAFSLPPLPTFSVFSDEQSTDIRWRNWLKRFENMMNALDIFDDEKKTSLLLHYAGEEVFSIYDRLSDEEKGFGPTHAADSTQYTIVKDSLMRHFTPNRNIQYETYKFRQTKQAPHEDINAFYARLRSLAAICRRRSRNTKPVN